MSSNKWRIHVYFCEPGKQDSQYRNTLGEISYAPTEQTAAVIAAGYASRKDVYRVDVEQESR